MFTAEKAREMSSVGSESKFHWVMGEIEKACKNGEYEVCLYTPFFASRKKAVSNQYLTVVKNLEKMGYKVKFVKEDIGFDHTLVSWEKDAS